MVGFWICFEGCCCSVDKSCLTLCNPMDCSTPGFPVLHHLLELAQTHVNGVGDAIQPYHVLCHLLLLLPSIFSSIRVFSSESALPIRWPKYWSFCISPSNEYSGLISFRIDWFDVLEVTDFIFLGSNTTKGKQKRWLTFLNHAISHTKIQFPVSLKNKKPEGDSKLGPPLFA